MAERIQTCRRVTPEVLARFRALPPWITRRQFAASVFGLDRPVVVKACDDVTWKVLYDSARLTWACEQIEKFSFHKESEE